VSKLRRNLYKAARVLGDVEAAEKGAASYARRRVRRKLYARQGGLSRWIPAGARVVGETLAPRRC
jgi:hypothetical protein